MNIWAAACYGPTIVSCGGGIVDVEIGVYWWGSTGLVVRVWSGGINRKAAACYGPTIDSYSGWGLIYSISKNKWLPCSPLIIIENNEENNFVRSIGSSGFWLFR